MTFDIVSVGDDFDKDHYDMVFFGGGQDYEQSIVAKDLPSKRDAIGQFIQDNKVILAICGGFQLLGQYYIQANGVRIDGIGVMGHYTLNQENNRYIGDIKIHNEEFDETYYGFENHQGRTFLSDDEKPLGKVVYGMVIIKKMVLRVSTIKMFMVATSMDQFFLVTPTLPTAWSQLPS